MQCFAGCFRKRTFIEQGSNPSPFRKALSGNEHKKRLFPTLFRAITSHHFKDILRFQFFTLSQDLSAKHLGPVMAQGKLTVTHG
jgi:hypothetical protein